MLLKQLTVEISAIKQNPIAFQVITVENTVPSENIVVGISSLIVFSRATYGNHILSRISCKKKKAPSRYRAIIQ
jgi:hypothetical protein